MKFQVEEQGGTTKVVVSGEITEETDFAPILDAKGRTILVDLGGVSRINSCGVREWLNFVTALEQRGRQLVLERCAPVIVTQLNTIYNFAGDGHVLSVLGPYYCARCDREDNQLIELAKTRSIPESIKCSSCGGEMEFEEVHDHYLGFRDGSS